jgi:transcriptional regulator with XRE-family HTH domain
MKKRIPAPHAGRPRLAAFISALADRLATRRGSKSELAATLGVRPHQLSEWLSGRNAPGAEYILGIQEWLKTRNPR